MVLTASFSRVRKLLSQAPVLTFGSIHLSLMAALGLWLWSNPSKFGTPIHCDPSLSIVGGLVPFSSQALRSCSLFLYSLLLVPGVNLFPPFIFFLAPHILYNKFRRRHRQPWMRRRLMAIVQRIQIILRYRKQGCPPDEEARVVDNIPSHEHKLPLGEEAQATDDSSKSPVPATSNVYVYTGSLVVGLAFLVVFNIVFLVDIELTLRQNKRVQSDGEDEWGFGQVLALLLLVVPLRDFVKSITTIQRNIRDQAQHDLQRSFQNERLPGVEHVMALIKRGADLDKPFESMLFLLFSRGCS